jgi:SAM-dependent methyltransferase
MRQDLLERIWEILACSYCGGSLSRKDNGAKCKDCQAEYIYSNKGQLDLRLQRRKSYHLQLVLGTKLLPDEGFDFKILQKNPSPQVDFTKIKVPHHLTGELISYFPKAKRNRSVMLDIGCGRTIHREVCEHAGFEYVGFDIDSPDALILGDAHAIPFKADSFEFILSIAMLEHIRYPFVAMNELYRILKPGGKFIGTVAFLEPFHGDSFYHHTHFGTFNSLKTAGFNIEHIAPNKDWPVLIAQAKMSLFPNLPGLISRYLILPLHLLHRVWWNLAYLITHRSVNEGERRRMLLTAGSFFFIATKN